MARVSVSAYLPRGEPMNINDALIAAAVGLPIAALSAWVSLAVKVINDQLDDGVEGMLLDL